MSEYKFKIGDRVRNLEDDKSLDIFIGDIGTIDQNNNSVPWVKWDKGIREAQYEEQLELITEEKESLMKEYKWNEAVEMVLADNSLELECDRMEGKLFSKNNAIYLKYENSDDCSILITKHFTTSTWTIVKPKLDLSTLKVDDKIIVWIDASPNDRYNRYFAKYEDNKIHAFTSGRSSFTSENNSTIPWDNCELYTEES